MGHFSTILPVEVQCKSQLKSSKSQFKFDNKHLQTVQHILGQKSSIFMIVWGALDSSTRVKLSNHQK